jgi:ribonucleoside-diphosphate reductase beta chain
VSECDKVSEPVALLAPGALFALAESQHWSANDIDLRADVAEWAGLPLGLRERLLWHTAAFFVGEEQVAVQLSPLVAAHDTLAEAAFLASQQADEARHAVYFDRFHSEVVGLGGSAEDRLGLAREELGGDLVKLLDGELADAAQRLHDDARDALAKVDFIVTYHMVIEGMLALTGQRMLLAFLEDKRILPGFAEGLRLIARDEHRHIAYGAWALGERAREPTLAARVGDRLARLAPLAAGVFVPPGGRPERFRPLGWSGARAQREAYDGLARRLAAIHIAAPAVLAPA